MNLFDIVKRKDRALEVLEHSIEIVHRGKPNAYFGARMPAGARVRLRRANEFTCLRTFPRDIGWRYFVPQDATEGATLRIEAVEQGQDEGVAPRSAVLCRAITCSADDPAEPPLLTWPAWLGTVGSFDIELANEGPGIVDIASSPVINSRTVLAPYLRGVGLEVGPGANPFVMATDDIDVRYLEAAPVSEWLSNYDHREVITQEKREFWDRYIIGDAQQLDVCNDSSLDFIFSSHVFEHFMNPIGVLKNWSRKLKPNGAILCVIPDLRYCFDLRQPPSTLEDWATEQSEEMWTLDLPKYEKWCRYTAPYNNPDDLIRRKYSIHAHYYTPITFLQMIDRLISEGVYSKYFVGTSPNNKDFAVALWA